MKRLRDSSLKYKIGAMTLLVAVVPLLIFGVAISFLYNEAFEERSRRQIRENLEVVADRLERVFSDGVLCSNYLTLNLNTIYQDESLRQVNRDNMIQSTLNKTILIFEGIDSLVFQAEEGSLYGTGYELHDRQEAIAASPYMEGLKVSRNGKTLLFDSLSDCMERDASRPVVTMGKRIVNITSGETLGYLFINIDVAQLEQSIRNEISGYMLLDSRGGTITGAGTDAWGLGADDQDLGSNVYQNLDREEDEASLQEANRIFSYEGDRYMLASKRLSGWDWNLVGVTNLSAYNVSVTEVVRTLLLAGGIILALLVLSSIFLTGILTRPLIRLSQGAEEIGKGNLDVEFRFKTGDEIGRMGHIFNEMTARIRRLLESVDQEARKKREYELALVQEQIKPHFLYNTLDIIIMLFELNKGREAVRVTRKLADYYKNSLSSSKEIVTLEREMRILEDYLDLQLMRYEDRFTYEIDIPAGVEDILIPKMTLQPLVENALYHGLKYKENWGNIRVVAMEGSEEVELRVEDNGIGMKPEEVERMLELGEKPENHFGVYSVNHRLKLYYGNDYGIRVDSRYGEGTVVRLRIPKEGPRREWRAE